MVGREEDSLAIASDSYDRIVVVPMSLFVASPF